MRTGQVSGRMTPTFDQRKQIQNQVFGMVRSKLNEAPFAHGQSGGPYTARDLGRLRALDEAVRGVGDIDIDGRRVDITLDLHDCAFAALPRDTAAVLEASQGSSDFALELVRRNLTELNAVARALYSSTEDQRLEDDGLRRLHVALSPVVELRGALLSAGIDVSQRDWAAVLTENVPNLRRLRSTPWHEVALLLKLIVVADDDDDDDDDGDANDDTLAAYDGSPTWENPPTRAEMRIIEELYAFGDGAPAIRRQVLGARLGLDVADQLEEMGIYDASAMTLQDTRELLKLAAVQLEEEEKEDAVELAGGKATGTATATEEEDVAGQTSRALPAIAAVLAKAAPVLLKSAPKLAKLTKLTKLGGKSGISKMGNKLNVMVSNGGGGDGGGGAAGALDKASGVIDSGNQVLSGLVTGIETVGKIKTLLTPDVEAAVASIQQEQARTQARIEVAREELERVSVDGTSEEALARVRTALDNALAAVAPPDGFLDPIAPGSTQALQSALQGQRLTLGEGNFGTGSYSSNEELVAKASGGAALYGMNFFPTTADIVNKPYTPILAPPSYVEMTGAVSDFTASVWQTTSMSKAAAFHSISENAGTSVANKVATSEGSSRSNATWFTGKSGGSGQQTENEETEASEEEVSLREANSALTSSATVIEYIRCPMKSFRIPMTRMVLSEDALRTAIEVNSIRDAEEFLDAFGSHVSNGRQELGGIFYSTLTMTSNETTTSSTLLSAASKQSKALATESKTTETGGSSGFLGISSKKAKSFGSAISVGSISKSTTAEGEGSTEQSVDARYTQYIRCAGPRAPTPETFADALFNDNSSWAVTDRGGIEALVPVTRVLENTIDLLDDDDPDKPPLQSSINFITAAWRIRAKRWGDVLLDEENANNDRVPTAILDLLRTAYPTAQGVVQDLVDSVYNALEFVEDSALWDKLPSYLAPSDRGGVIAVAPAMTQLPALDVGAEVIRSLRKAVDTATTGSSGADALLHYMDAEDVGDYIESEMKRKEKRNKAAYIERMVGAAADMDDEEVKAYLERLERDWDKLNPLARLGRKYGDQIAHPDDEAYWKNLKPWERSWITKDEGLFLNPKVDNSNRWTPEDYEVFQREYFRAPNPARFLPELEKGLELFMHSKNAITVRVVLEGDDDNNARRETVTEAALAMTNEDWVIFSKIWFDSNNPEETKRLVEIIQDHATRMGEIFTISKNLKNAKVELDAAFLSYNAASEGSAANLAEKESLDSQELEILNKLDAVELEMSNGNNHLIERQQRKEELESELRSVQDQIAVVLPQVDGSSPVNADLQARLRALKAKARGIEEDIAEVEAQISKLRSIIASKIAEKAALRQERDALAKKIKENTAQGAQYAVTLAETGTALSMLFPRFETLRAKQEIKQKNEMAAYYAGDPRFGGKRVTK